MRIVWTAVATLAALFVTWLRPEVYWSVLICGLAFVWELIIGEYEHSCAEPVAPNMQSTQPGLPTAVISAQRIEHDDAGMTIQLSTDNVEHMTWDELSMVVIETNSLGPFVDDVHWLLVGSDPERSWRMAADTAGFDDLLSRLQQLPAFDNDVVIDAMTSVDDARFLAWQRPT